MLKYRHDLPQMKSDLFLTDGGMETVLIFQDGIKLPHFASFPLLDSAEGRAHLTNYYENFLAIARRRGLGFVLDSATWRANPDWAATLGYNSAELADIHRISIAFLERLRAKWELPTSPIVLNGVVGPRGDGYKAGRMETDEAADYHGPQVEEFARTAADMVSATTMNTVEEAAGIALAAKAANMPCVVSFTVETDGRLVDGTSLATAVQAVDAATEESPAYYMINCAHPTHFTQALKRGESWVQRVRGLRANASAKSHAELDESTTLDAGDPADLGRRYGALRAAFPKLGVLGGCCGTDHRHIQAICEAVLPPLRKSA
jgi:S-methylmethionine-dependent homocysteine/selenocysteine methylase